MATIEAKILYYIKYDKDSLHQTFVYSSLKIKFFKEDIILVIKRMLESLTLNLKKTSSSNRQGLGILYVYGRALFL